MKTRTDIEVIIDNKRYTLCGYESEEYLQKVASYINGKYAELKKQDNAYRLMDAEMKGILMQINLVDDYFKLKKQLDEAENINGKQKNEIFNLKNEIVALKNRMEEVEREKELLLKENIEEQKKVVRLETELESLRR